ncbi:type VI secretion system Vgr family protein [Bowmanella denitrificans]|uniref:type VI secretion system Vgr family protein n=1 Tax=Bowmanella denitrificans TaxID=366582 RepID=UPI000C9C589A|nr:type VI secretion system tip protein TssI/VgrG [Bowmanella denitrificans]
MAGKRQVSITTPLGDELLLVSMSGEENLGRLFRYDVTLYAKKEDIKAIDLIGQQATIKVELENQQYRYFNGFITRFSQQGRATEGYAQYSAEIHPWLWFLNRTADCRIFQEMTVPDILKQVFADNGFTDYELKLSRSYRTWEYCVQYRESDLLFAMRLMEHEGIYFYFSHEQDKHKLILADAANAHSPLAGNSTIAYHLAGLFQRKEDSSIANWTSSCEVQTGCYASTDYDFKKPKSDLSANRIIQRSHAHADAEYFDYPGEYTESADGDNYTLTRIEEMQADFEVHRGETDARTMTCGGLFTLSEHPRDDRNQEYLITHCQYELNANPYGSGGGGEQPFQCNFTAIASKTPFRPARTTARPVVQGPQTAVVVGPAGEEIYPDKYGRVKVQFFWDRYGQTDENSSCWIRVAQTWSGKAWGAQIIPRIGHEVIVEFLEGDPDKPLIVGSVYNADNMPPYSLPANKTQSGIKTRSSPGGSASNFNEIRMEDKKGNEELYIQAEKDENILVKNNKTETVGVDETIDIGHDRSDTIGNDETISVGNNRTESVGNDETISIGNNRTETVASNETISIGANRSRDVGGNESVSIGQSRTHTVAINEAIAIGAAQEIVIGGAQAVEIGAAQNTDVGLNQLVSVGKNRSVDVGDDDSLKVGKNLVIDVGDAVIIKCGKASISMKKDGTISISGKDISIKGSGAIDVKASKDLVLKGKKILQN